MPNTEPSNNAPDAGAARALLVHSAGPAEGAGLAAALRSAGNAAAALAPGVPVEVGQGIRILACGNSLRSVELTPGQLLPGVESVPAAISHLATRQWEGWAYVRL